ncbi:hypothetical protein RF11_08159 [Thelohanellus kitauei]|uniref:Uncharacterized protein n=1 Tax=Thelohanellus kitauei TaxID=669202 RepID=A0A0C2IG69_THEKT|nr:hypothetical protein RF11_08159 [Thelohanellus kitauei]
MDVVRRVNKIRSSALNRREFRQFLSDMKEEYGELLLHFEKAQNLQLYVGDEGRHILTLESIEAYLEVAEFAEANELEYRKIVHGYEEASQMLYDIDENRAIECFRKSIDTYVKHGDINKAIQRCIQYGYAMNSETDDAVKGEEFFAQAERLRAEHKIPHSCVINTFERRKYDFEDYKTLKELVRKIISNALNVKLHFPDTVSFLNKIICAIVKKVWIHVQTALKFARVARII